MKKLLVLLLSFGLIYSSSAGEVDTNIIKTQALNACADCNLKGADLTGTNHSETNLSGANLSDADLSEADLVGANLIRANLSKADLSGANLRDAKLSKATLCNAETPWGIDDSGC